MKDAAAVAPLKQVAREVWSEGDFDAVAQKILESGEALVEAVGMKPGDRVLDVAAGTGNATIPAALAAGSATALDLTPELFEAGRRRAEAAGAEIEWVEGDAESLPFEDGSFDVVLSVFGVMFAPRHDVAAAELARVLAPGGRMGVSAWTPEGAIGDFFRTVSGYMPKQDDPPPPPPLWGVEDHVRGLFEGTGIELAFERDHVTFEFGSAEQATAFYEENFGPVIMCKRFNEPQGRWPEARAAISESFARSSSPAGDGIAVHGEYLRTLGRKQS